MVLPLWGTAWLVSIVMKRTLNLTPRCWQNPSWLLRRHLVGLLIRPLFKLQIKRPLINARH